MANTPLLKKYAEITKTKVAADFGLGSVASILSWGSEGVGPNFNMITQIANTTTTPIPGVNIVTENYRRTPAADIFALYFNGLGLPPNYFSAATMRFTTNTVQIWRNQEDVA
jgi:hypothetical protein